MKLIGWLGVWLVLGALEVVAGPEKPLCTTAEDCFKQGQFELAAQKWEEARAKLVTKTCLPQDYATLSVNSAQIYADMSVSQAEAFQSLGLLQNALDVLKCAESVTQQKLGNSLFHANVLNELSNIYRVMGDMEDHNCQFKGRRAVREENLKNSRDYANKAVDAMNKAEVVKRDETNLKLVNARILNNYGNILMTDGKYEKAIQKYEEAAKFAKEGQDYLLRTGILLNIAQTTVEKGSGEETYKNVIKDTQTEIKKLPSKREKLFHFTGLAYIVRNLLQKHTELPPDWGLSLNSLLNVLLNDYLSEKNPLTPDDAIAFAKNYLARSYADRITKDCVSKGKAPGCGDFDHDEPFSKYAKTFIEQAIREVQRSGLSRKSGRTTDRTDRLDGKSI